MSLISIFQAVIWIYVLYLCVVELNKMTRQTSAVVRWAHVALACGAATGIMSAISGIQFFGLLIAGGVAAYMTFNRRGAK